MSHRLAAACALILVAAACAAPPPTLAPSPPPTGSPVATPFTAGPDTAAAPAPAGPSATPCSAAATPAQAEGPYYRAGSPARAALIEQDTVGEPVLLRGAVLRLGDCLPLAGARIDLWQADGAGRYDNAGFGLRGHQATDESGRYAFETVLPGVYPGRTPHLHIKIFAADGRELLTTQVYIPGLSEGMPDFLFDAQLLARDEGRDEGGRRVLSFDVYVRDGPG